MNAPPIKNVGRHLCVPPLVGSCHFPQADWFRCVGRGLAPAAGRGGRLRPNAPDNGTRYRKKAAVRHPVMGWGRRPYGFAVGIAPSADGALGRLGISRRARRGSFARCGGREFRWLRPATRGAASGLRELLKKLDQNFYLWVLTRRGAPYRDGGTWSFSLPAGYSDILYNGIGDPTAAFSIPRRCTAYRSREFPPLS